MKTLWPLVLSACALTRNAPPVPVHYYDPPLATEPPEVQPPAPRARVRMGRVDSDSHLRYSIAFRTSPVSLELYDDDRWTDMPSTYVERSLEHALFAKRPLEQATTGSALSLDIDVLAFEEVRQPHPGGRVQLRYRLRDDRSVIETDTVTVVRNARGSSLADVVTAIGQALDAATGQIADRVLDASVAHSLQPKGHDDVSGRRLSTRR